MKMILGLVLILSFFSIRNDSFENVFTILIIFLHRILQQKKRIDPFQKAIDNKIPILFGNVRQYFFSIFLAIFSPIKIALKKYQMKCIVGDIAN